MKKILNSIIISIFLLGGIQQTKAQAGAALNFNGSNNYINAGTPITNLTGYTKEAWIYASASGSNNIISSNQSPFWLAGNKLSAAHQWASLGTITVQDPATFPLNVWTHVAITYNGATNTMTLYKNGVAVATNTTAPAYVAENIEIGAYNVSNFFAGNIDEVKIFNYPLSQCQINAGMNCEFAASKAGLAAYYKFNEGVASGSNSTITTAVDSSGNGNNGTLTNFTLSGTTSNWITPGAVTSGVACSNIVGVATNTATITAGGTATLTATGATTYTWSTGATTASIVVSPTVTTIYTVAGTENGCTSGVVTTTVYLPAAALNFNGTNNYIAISAGSALNNLGLANFTMEAWVNPGSISGVQSIIRKSGDYNLYLNNGVLYAEVWTNGMGNTARQIVSGSTTLSADTWAHVAFTWNNSLNTGVLYVNGIAQTITTNASPISSSESLQIGESSEYGQPFAGSMDEVRIWNRALCGSEILNNMNAELKVVGQTGLVAYYPFNEGIAAGTNPAVTNAADSSGNGNNGTLTNFALTGTTSNWVNPGAITTGSYSPTFTASTSPISVTTATNTICSGSSTTFTASGSSYYAWLPATNLSSSTSATITASPTTTTIYTVSNGCAGSPTTTLTLNVNASPTAVISGATSICGGGGTTTLTISDGASTGGPYTYNWSNGSIAAASNSISTVGTYTVGITNGVGCSATGLQAVILNPISVTSTGGTASACYASLNAGFTAINNGTHTGTISITVNGSTIESSICILNASGSGSASYSSIIMQPTGAYTIQGSFSANSLITLNGASNVTINGLNSLILANTNGSTVAGTGTLLFINDASNNVITNCTVLCNALMAVGTTGGPIMFSTTTGITGNDNNTISYCNLGPVTGNSLTKVIYMGGSSNNDPGTANSGIVIDHNNIYDYFRSNANSAGIDLNSGTVGTVISNNKFYQTGTRTYTFPNLFHRAISINNTAGNGYQISGNTIGYNSNAGTGTYFLQFNSSSTTTQFVPIYLNVGTTTATSVQSNTITNIGITGASSGTAANAPFKGIYVFGGLTNVSGNTIGSMSATGNISYLSTNAAASDIYGILNIGAGDWVTNNNNIGGFTVTKATVSNTCNFYGIRSVTGAAHNWTCSNNTIGGSVANSIQSLTTNVATIVEGIANNNSTCKFTKNSIQNLTSAGGNTNGIYNNSLQIDTLSQNTVSTLSSGGVGGGAGVCGILSGGSGLGSLIERNLVYGLSGVNNNYGISVSGSNSTYQNNMIAINTGTASTVLAAGIYETNGSNNIWNNSIYMSGAPVSGNQTTYAFYSTFNGVMSRSYRDNIFVNAVSNNGATGANYIVSVAGTAANPAGVTLNNNLYYGTGTGSVFGYFNSANVANLTAWQTAVGLDANSFVGDPLFIAPTATPPNLRISTSGSTSPADAAGADMGILNDFDAQTRASLTPVDIGAFAFIACATPTVTISGTNTLCVGNTTTLTAAGATNYTWSTSATTATVSPSPTVTTSYTVTGGAGTCTNTAVITVTVNALPAVTVNSATICAGSAITLTAGGTLLSYTWNTGATTTTISATPTVTTNYTVTGTDVNNCVNTATSTVTVNTLPMITVSTATTCAGSIATLTASGTATSYTWSTGTIGATIDPSPTTTTYYTVTGTDLNNCLNTATSTVIVNALPTISVNSGAICNGQSFTLTPSGANTYTFSTASVVSPTTTTSYSVIGTSIAGCLGSNTAVSTITVNALPTITVNTASVCVGNAATLTASGASNYTWNTGATGATITPSPTVTTNYTVTGTGAGNCINAATTAITVNSLPTYSLTGNVYTICSGGSQTFTVSGASTYTWAPAATLTGANTANPTANPTTTTVYSVTGTNASGCINAAATVTVNVNSAPTLTLTANTYSICNGSTQTFAVSGASSYTWTPAATLTNPNTATPTANPTTTTVYTISGTASGCSPSPAKTLTLTVNALPVYSLTANSYSICNGSTQTFTVSGASSYTWTPSATLTGANTANPTANPTTTTVYSVTGTSSNGCTNATPATLILTVNSLPTISVNSGAICNGQSFTMTPSGASSYTYSSGSSMVSPTTTSSYSITGTSATGCLGSNTAVSIVTVNAVPTISVNSGAICNGQSFTLTPNGANTYTYSSGSSVVTPTANTTYSITGTNAAGCLGSNTAISTVTVKNASTATISPVACNSITVNANTYTASGTYTQNLTNAQGCDSTLTIHVTIKTPTTATISPNACNGVTVNATTYTASGTYTQNLTNVQGCDSTLIINATVNPLPMISLNSSTICIGATTTLIASGTATSYTWNTGATGASISPLPTVTTNYTVTGTDINGCINTVIDTITVNALPSLTVTPQTICPSATATLVANPTSLVSYTWSPGLSSTSGSIITGSPVVYTSYSVSATDANGCVGMATTSINVVSSLTVTAVATNTAVCGAGSSTTLTGLGASSYTWSSSDGTVNGITGTNITVTPSGTSTTYTVNGSSGVCTASPYTLTVNINTLPTVTITASPTTICAGNTTILTASGANTYTWNTSATGISITDSPIMTTSYSVTGTDGNNCKNTATSMVTVNSLPTLTITASATTICIGNTTTLTASGANSYTWSNTGATGTNINTSPNVTTQYTVTGTDGNNCMNSDTVSIIVNNCTTGIEQPSNNDNQISVYPNPNNGNFVIEISNKMSNVRYILYDINGREILNQTINGKINVDASSLINGVYNLTIISDKGSVNKRVVITK